MGKNKRTFSKLLFVTVIIIGITPILFNLESGKALGQPPNGSRRGGQPDGQGMSNQGPRGSQNPMSGRGGGAPGGGAPGGGRIGRGFPQTPGGPRGTFSPTDEEVDQILEEVRQNDPNRAAQIEEIRQSNPENFNNELRRLAPQEVGHYMENQASRGYFGVRRSDFLEWLAENLPAVAQELDAIKNQDYILWSQRFELTWRRYSSIFDQSQTNPELATILLEDLALEEKQNNLQMQLRNTEDEEEKNTLSEQLKDTVSQRYDIIVEKMELEYQEQLKILEEIKQQLDAKLAEIEVWKNPEYKEQEVQNQFNRVTNPRRMNRGPFDIGRGFN